MQLYYAYNNESISQRHPLIETTCFDRNIKIKKTSSSSRWRGWWWEKKKRKKFVTIEEHNKSTGLSGDDTVNASKWKPEVPKAYEKFVFAANYNGQKNETSSKFIARPSETKKRKKRKYISKRRAKFEAVGIYRRAIFCAWCRKKGVER